MPKMNAETFTGPLFLLGASLVAMASMVAVVVSSPSEAQDRTTITLPQPQFSATSSTVADSTPSTVEADTTPPPIFVTAGVDGATVDNPAFTVAGTTEPSTQMTVNGSAVVADASGNWSLPVTLNLGPNAIQVKATDPAGNESTLTITVTYAVPVATTTTAPPAPAPTTTAKPKPKPTNPPTTPPTTPTTSPPPPTTPPPPVDTGP